MLKSLLGSFIDPVLNTEAKVKVLIVEDEVTIRKLWMEMIQSIVDVCFAGSVTEALAEMNSEEKPDILVLDWILLNGNGSSVLDFWMRNNGGPCCIITGSVTMEDESIFYSRGVLHVLRKPLHIAIFLAVINQYKVIIKHKQETIWLKKKLAGIEKRQIFLLILIVAISGGFEVLNKVIPMVMP